MSHVENGAVNGKRPRTINTMAADRRSMDATEARRTPGTIGNAGPVRGSAFLPQDIRVGSPPKENISVYIPKNTARAIGEFTRFCSTKCFVSIGAFAGVEIATQCVVISRIFASVLIVLTLSPVTAPFSPFSTCELGGFFGRTQSQQSLPPRMPASNNKSASAPATLLPAVGAVGARVRLLTFTSLRVSPISQLAGSTFRQHSLNSGSGRVHATPVTNLRV
jgi:hypothetical protein